MNREKRSLNPSSSPDRDFYADGNSSLLLILSNRVATDYFMA
jgi:hypothetical protein